MSEWIEWKGKSLYRTNVKYNHPEDCALDTLVEVRLRNGDETVAGKAGEFDWKWSESLSKADIIAYRIVEDAPAKEEPKERKFFVSYRHLDEKSIENFGHTIKSISGELTSGITTQWSHEIAMKQGLPSQVVITFFYPLEG